MNDVTVSSPASQEQMESETGSVLVDWHHEESMTTKSFPVTPNTRERCSILPRKAVSLFDGDSDSSEEYTQQRRQKNTTRRSKMRKSGSLFHAVTVRDGKLKIFTTTPTVEKNSPPPSFQQIFPVKLTHSNKSIIKNTPSRDLPTTTKTKNKT